MTYRTAVRNQTNQRRGIASEELRRHNLGAVLERLHHGGPASRSALTRATGLNRSTIADLIGELTTLGLVDEERGTSNSGPGRPSPVAYARSDGATTLAIELSVDSTAVAVVGLGGTVLDKVRVPRSRVESSPEGSVADAAARARGMLGKDSRTATLVGVGVGIVGVTRRADGFVHLAPNLGWSEVPLADMLRAELNVVVPIQVANEADLGALAEHRRGAGVGFHHLIYVSGEAGVGAGIIHEGRPMLGSAGYAGEAGHAVINPEGRVCRCGSKGCWETEAGEDALARSGGVPSTTLRESIIDEILERARSGDAQALEGIREVGGWLGLGIGNLINIFNPELVLLGGFYHSLFPFFSDVVESGARKSALGAPGSMTRILASGLGVDAPLFGAAELAFADLIADPAGTLDRVLSPAPTV